MRWPLIVFAGLLLPALSLAQTPPASEPTSTPAPPANPRCSDGVVSPEEECDDGNILNGDGCSISCHLEKCGDGTVQSDRGETCDDGNAASFDGCSSTCALEKPYRSRKAGFYISAGVSILGIPLSSALDSPIPMLVSFGVGPTLGRLYVRDYPQALIYTGLRAGSLGLLELGFLLAQRSFRAENIGNGIPLDAFPGDGSFLLAGTIVVTSIGLFATIAVVDIFAVRVGPQLRFSEGPSHPIKQSLTLAPLITPQSSAFGLSLHARF